MINIKTSPANNQFFRQLRDDIITDYSINMQRSPAENEAIIAVYNDSAVITFDNNDTNPTSAISVVPTEPIAFDMPFGDNIDVTVSTRVNALIAAEAKRNPLGSKHNVIIGIFDDAVLIVSAEEDGFQASVFECEPVFYDNDILTKLETSYVPSSLDQMFLKASKDGGVGAPGGNVMTPLEVLYRTRAQVDTLITALEAYKEVTGEEFGGDTAITVKDGDAFLVVSTDEQGGVGVKYVTDAPVFIPQNINPADPGNATAAALECITSSGLLGTDKEPALVLFRDAEVLVENGENPIRCTLMFSPIFDIKHEDEEESFEVEWTNVDENGNTIYGTIPCDIDADAGEDGWESFGFAPGKCTRDNGFSAGNEVISDNAIGNFLDDLMNGWGDEDEG